MQGRRSLAALATVAVTAISACSSSTSPATPARKPTPTPSPLAGSITIGGTVGDLRLVAAARGAFQAANPKASVQSSVTALGGELAAVLGGSVSAALTDYPRTAVTGLANADKLVDHKVAVNRVIVIADPNQPVGSLTIQQLGDIFAGRDGNWNQVGGSNTPIFPVGPPVASATRRAFDKLVMAGSPQGSGIQPQPTPRGVAQLVSTTPGAIGYLLASDLEPTDTVRRLQVSGVDPTAENVERGTYPLWFHVHLYTLGPARGAVATFIQLLTTAKLQDSDAVQLAGFVPPNRVYGESPSDK
jgi:phosphate transport system substrate-binding protein